MRTYYKANLIFGGVVTIFLFFFVCRIYFPENFTVALCFAAAEAALVGGIADWFAVTALFKKPLGFGWHTALIPRHRDKVTDAMAELVQRHLLSIETIEDHLSGIRLVEYIIKWGENKEELIVQKLLKYGEKIFAELERGETSNEIAEKIKKRLASRNLMPFYQQMLEWLYRNKKVDEGIDILLAVMLELIERPSFLDYLISLVEEYSKPKERKRTESLWEALKEAATQFLLGAAEGADILNAKEAASTIQQELISLIQEAKNTDSPLRCAIIEQLQEIYTQLKEDEDMQRSILQWQKGLLLEINLQPIGFVILRSLKTAFSAETAENTKLTLWLAERIKKYWKGFAQSRPMQDWLERYLQKAIKRLVVNQNEFIGRVIIEVLTNLSDAELNDIIEAKAGKDLEWIRINGSVVGAAAGTALFLFVQIVYYPMVWPIVRQITNR